MKPGCKTIALLALQCVMYGCSESPEQKNSNRVDKTTPASQAVAMAIPVVKTGNAERQPFFGDLHVHTSYSLDGYIICCTNE